MIANIESSFSVCYCCWALQILLSSIYYWKWINVTFLIQLKIYLCHQRNFIWRFQLIKLNYLSNECDGKPYCFENESESSFKYGFKTCKCPPQHKDLMEFEDYLQKMISNVQFTRVENDFQNRLKNHIRSIQSSKKVFVFADKTRNIHVMEKSHHEKLLTDNITKTHKQSNNNVYNSISLEAKYIAKKTWNSKWSWLYGQKTSLHNTNRP